MRSLNFFRTALAMSFGVMGLSSCYKMAESVTPKREINYDAAYVINGESSSISVIDISTNQVRETILLGKTSGGHGEDMSSDISWPHHIYINPRRTEVVIGVPGMDLSGGHSGGMDGMKGKSVILNVRTGEIIKVIESPVSNHNSVYSPDGTEIWTGQMEEAGKVLIYDANTFALKKTIEVGNEPSEVTFSSDGSTAFVANSMSNSITAIKVSDKAVLKTIPVDDDPVGAWPGKDNKMYVDNEHEETISVIDVATLEVEEVVNLGFMPGMAAYNSTNEELWVTDAENGKAVVFKRINDFWTMAESVDTGAGAHGIAFTKDEKTAYITNQFAESVSVINTETKSKVTDIKVGKKPNGLVIREGI